MSDFFAKSEELDPTVFWSNFDKVIKSKGMTITGLCFIAGVSEKSVRGAKSKNHIPLLSTAYALAKYLEVSLEYLITGVEPLERIPDDLQQVINKYAN